MPGEQNAADILSKHWGYSDVWPTMRPLLFYEGDTSKIFEEEATKKKQKPLKVDVTEEDKSGKT
jgi:hypothetical protein